MTLAGIIKSVFSLPNRQTEGFFRALSQFIGIDAPDHTTIGRRVSKLNLSMDEELARSDIPVRISLGSSGVIIEDGRDWLRNDYRGVDRGWLRLRVAVDTRKRRILNVEVSSYASWDTKPEVGFSVPI